MKEKIIASVLFVVAFSVSATETFTLVSPCANATVSAKGGRILSWKDAAGRERLFMPAKPESAGGDWSHGGVSVCWPWFGRKGDKQSLIHGFARNLVFTLRGREKTAHGETLTLGAVAPGLDLELAYSLTDKLTMKMTTRNLAASPAEVSLGIQAYFPVSAYRNIVFSGVKDKDFAAVDGMDKAFGRLGAKFGFRDSGSRRAVALEAAGNTGLVVWTPGTVEPANRNLAVDDCPRFVVIGPCSRKAEGAVTLDPGKTHELSCAFKCEDAP
jgi:glucose-6-phosphate 1-epimerase